MTSGKNSEFEVGRLKGDSVLKAIVAAAAIAIVVLLAALAYELVSGSRPSIAKFGLSFVWITTWDPVHTIFGALPFIFGTVVTSLLALLIGLPISLGVAIFLTEKLKARTGAGNLIGTLIELLAAVPSVIYGLWGLLPEPCSQAIRRDPSTQISRICPTLLWNPVRSGLLHRRSSACHHDNPDRLGDIEERPERRPE